MILNAPIFRVDQRRRYNWFLCIDQKIQVIIGWWLLLIKLRVQNLKGLLLLSCGMRTGWGRTWTDKRTWSVHVQDTSC